MMFYNVGMNEQKRDNENNMKIKNIYRTRHSQTQ